MLPTVIEVWPAELTHQLQEPTWAYSSGASGHGPVRSKSATRSPRRRLRLRLIDFMLSRGLTSVEKPHALANAIIYWEKNYVAFSNCKIPLTKSFLTFKKLKLFFIKIVVCNKNSIFGDMCKSELIPFSPESEPRIYLHDIVGSSILVTNRLLQC